MKVVMLYANRIIIVRMNAELYLQHFRRQQWSLLNI